MVLGTTPAWALTGGQEAKLLPADGAATDQFGVSVALGGDTAVAGANLDDDNGSNSGSAYVFRLLQDGGGDVPALSAVGTMLLLLVMAVTGVHLARRRVPD